LSYKTVNIINPCNPRSSVADKNFSHRLTPISLIPQVQSHQCLQDWCHVSQPTRRN